MDSTVLALPSPWITFPFRDSTKEEQLVIDDGSTSTYEISRTFSFSTLSFLASTLTPGPSSKSDKVEG